MMFAERYLPCIRSWDAVSWSGYIRMHWSMSFGCVAYHMSANARYKLLTRGILLANHTARISCVTAKSLWN